MIEEAIVANAKIDKMGLHGNGTYLPLMKRVQKLKKLSKRHSVLIFHQKFVIIFMKVEKTKVFKYFTTTAKEDNHEA